MRYTLPLLTLIMMAMLTGCTSTAKKEPLENYITHDGNISIIWKNPSQFTDIESTTWLQSKFTPYLFSELTDELGQMANKTLGKNQKLDLMVTNVDLAGGVESTFGATVNDIRVVSDLYPPKISFDYSLSQDGKVIMSGSEKIQNMGFLFGIQPITSQPFPYESELLTKWFKDKIKPKLVK
jgi:hypothetical protein